MKTFIGYFFSLLNSFFGDSEEIYANGMNNIFNIVAAANNFLKALIIVDEGR